MSNPICPECQEELEFYHEIVGDREMTFGCYYCENKDCKNFEKEICNSGDFE